MSDAAGSINIVLSVNKANFSAAMADAQRQLDTFAGKAKGAGHGTVSSMQAASASIRLLENPLGNNIRAIERLLSQSKLLSGVMKAAFPLVGAIAIGGMIAKLGGEVAEFITKVNQMPKAIAQGFNALNLSSKEATDELTLTNDKIADAIAKIEHKPAVNAAKIALDESTVAADKLATSITGANAKLNELLSKNHLSGWALLLGKPGTADREGTAKAFGAQADDAAYDLANATNPEQTAAAKKKLLDTQNAQLAEARRDLAARQQIAGSEDHLNDSANINIDKGVITQILQAQKQQAAEIENGRISAEKETADNKKAADDAKKSAARAALEAQHKAAQEQLKGFEGDNEAWKAAQDRSLADDAAWWLQKLKQLKTGSLNFDEVYKRINKDAAEAQHEYSQSIEKYSTAFFNEGDKRSWVSPEDTITIKALGSATVEWIKALRESMTLSKRNADAMAESSIQMGFATGQLTKLDAAQQIANLHSAQYAAQMAALQDSRDGILNNSSLSDMERKAQLAQIDNSIMSTQNQRDLQVKQDNEATNPQASSAMVGFANALDEFVISTRDAAGQMREIATSSLNTVNSEIVKAMSGQRTSFSNAGASIFRNVASIGLQKAEGAILGGLGFGGKADGSQSKPLYVRIAGGMTGAASSLASKAAGGVGGFFGSLMQHLPMFADGGPISANMMSIVGERGPELFMPSMAGHIIPNHQLSGSRGNGDIHINVDATGATDPAQTHAAVVRGITFAAPQIVAASQQASLERNRRTPASARR